MATQCCTKAFSLLVEQQMLYYKMEGLVNKSGVLYQVDSASGYDLRHYDLFSTNDYTTIAGIQGNCYQQVGKANAPHDDSASVPWTTTDQSMTFRAWLWQNTGAQSRPLRVLFSSLASMSMQWEVGGGSVLQMQITQSLRNAAALSSANVVLITPITTSNWHHFVVAFNIGTGVCTTYMDNVPVDTFTHPAGYSFRGTAFNVYDNSLITAGKTIRVDEVMVLNGACWNAAEVALDWNGGAGRTYPF